MSAEFSLDDQLDKFEASIGEKVILGGVAAAARVFYDEVKLNASGVRGHPKQQSGDLYDSIYRAYAEKEATPQVKSYFVSWNKSKAPHGHLIEFGTSQAPAYPFVRPAFGLANEAGRVGLARMAEVLSLVESK